jgi:hypothetical protein
VVIHDAVTLRLHDMSEDPRSVASPPGTAVTAELPLEP